MKNFIGTLSQITLVFDTTRKGKEEMMRIWKILLGTEKVNTWGLDTLPYTSEGDPHIGCKIMYPGNRIEFRSNKHSGKVFLKAEEKISFSGSGKPGRYVSLPKGKYRTQAVSEYHDGKKFNLENLLKKRLFKQKVTDRYHTTP